MVDRIQYHIPDWNAGTDELTFEQEAAYRKLCDAYYLTDGNLKDDHKINARRLKISVRLYKRLRQELLDAGKFEVVEGYLKHRRADRELLKVFETSHKAREKAAKRWRKFPEKSAKSLEQIEMDYAGGDANPLTRKHEKEKIYKKENQGEPLPADWQPDEATRAWAVGQGLDGTEIDLQTEKFCNHWRGKAGDHRRGDWSAVFRNWIIEGRRMNGSAYGAKTVDDDKIEISVRCGEGVAEEHREAWRAVLAEMSVGVGKNRIAAYHGACTLRAASGGGFVVESPNAFVRNWILDNYDAHFARTMAAHGLRDFAVTVAVGDD